MQLILRSVHKLFVVLSWNRFGFTWSRRRTSNGWSSRGFTGVRTTTSARCQSLTSTLRTWTNTSAVLNGSSSRHLLTGVLTASSTAWWSINLNKFSASAYRSSVKKPCVPKLVVKSSAMFFWQFSDCFRSFTVMLCCSIFTLILCQLVFMSCCVVLHDISC